MNNLRNILLIWWSDLRDMLRDQGVVLFVIAVPLAYPLLYALIYDNETTRDVPVAVVDYSQSQLSRQFIRMLDATADVAVVARPATMAEAEELNRRSEVYGIVAIPQDLNERILKGEQAIIGVYSDMAGLLYYKALLLAATDASLELNKRLKIERLIPGGTSQQQQITTQPIDYDYVTLYNPQSGFASFLMPAVLILILQQTLLLGIGMSNGGVRERFGGFGIKSGHVFHNAFNAVIGKALAYSGLYLILAAYMFIVVTRIFTLPQLGDFGDYMLFMLPFLLASTFMAITLSTFIYRREDCMLLFVFMSVPLLFISGISWPGASVPEFWKWIGRIFPSTFAANGYVRINSMGADLADVRSEYIGLWIQTGIYFMTSVVLYRRELRRKLKVATKQILP